MIFSSGCYSKAFIKSRRFCRGFDLAYKRASAMLRNTLRLLRTTGTPPSVQLDAVQNCMRICELLKSTFKYHKSNLVAYETPSSLFNNDSEFYDFASRLNNWSLLQQIDKLWRGMIFIKYFINIYLFYKLANMLSVLLGFLMLFSIICAQLVCLVVLSIQCLMLTSALWYVIFNFCKLC